MVTLTFTLYQRGFVKRVLRGRLNTDCNKDKFNNIPPYFWNSCKGLMIEMSTGPNNILSVEFALNKHAIYKFFYMKIISYLSILNISLKDEFKRHHFNYMALNKYFFCYFRVQDINLNFSLQ